MVTENGAQSDGNTSFLRAARAGNLDKVLEHLKNNIDINTCNANGLNALHLASKDGHVHVVSELLKRGAIVDSATKKGNTALHIASLAGQEEVVKLLLQHNASVNVQSQNGFTPLYMAAQENHDSVVKLLLANGANQSLATEDGFTPLAVAMQQGHDKVVAVLLESDTRGKVRLPALHIAAKKDDVKAATLLLENDHNPDVTSKSGFTPLHIASHYGNESIAILLIQKGADVNYAAKHNISPLHVAAKWGKTNMVSLLLEKGANIESKTRDGLTPLHCAARSGHEQVVDMLLERGAPISAKTKNGLAPLHMAAQGEHVDAARILLYHRAPVDEVTVDYLTALHVAAHCGHVRVAKLLLDRSADANARALNGFTPLHIACKKNRIKVVELLLKHGASISATTESGLTPLHVASFMGCMNIVIYLLQHDASPDVPTVRGETPLHLAARANQTDIIRILLRNGAQVDARAREQQTPLHIASRLGNVDIVMLLLQHGAQVDATTKDMYTALHIAAKEGQDEVAGVLIENGASLDATTKKGFTPLHLTAKYGHMKVAQLLLQKDAAVDAQGKNGVTPLHVASHYDHQNVALLLLEKGASPHATAKNGHTPLHIAARKNQMDIATTLLEYGAHADAESKAGFTPLHLSSQEGHTDMSSLLLEHKAGVDHQARNGLTPLHLCAQEDKVNVAQVLVKNGANIEMQTKAGYTPLHVASHFGQAHMVRFLLQNGANVDAATAIGYTPLHQAAQQGHCHIVNLLLEHKANPNAQTSNGQTPLHIARRLGYISVLDSLKTITNETVSPTQTPQTEEKYRVVAPEAMHETFMSDSEEEGGEDTLLSDQPYRYLTVDEMKSLGDDSLPIDVTRDERIDSNRMVQSTDSTGHPPQAIEDIISPQHAQVHMSAKPDSESKFIADNIHMDRHPQHVGFLVSFLVDARGGAMRGCRHSGVRIIVPARSASQPTRITCRYVKPQRTMHPPQLMEGEALASRVLELGPVASKFLGPVIMEVPHFASLRGKEREIVILRSDNGETWREHTIDNSDEIIHDVLSECFEPEEISQLDELGGGRICRFVTYDFPQYFAVVSRIRQEVHAIGPEGGMVSSTVVPQVQAVFPQGALTKKIKVGLQAQPIDPDLTAKLLGRGVAVSPIVTVEPRRRKFHKAITLSMPAPKAHSQGMINQYSGNAPTLRLLCSITGGPSRAQWEDVTGSTPLTFVNDCVSFTTTVSARFWLMDCRNISDATKMATELYREAIHVPFMAKFVVFAKRVDPNEARLRVFCMTDDKEDKTLEHQENFTEVAKSRDVEVLEGKSQYIEMAGNLVPVTKSGDQLQLTFKAFRENRLPFNVRVKDQHADIVGRTLFMREPKVAKGEPPQQPICILNIVLPENIIPDQTIPMTDAQEIITRMDVTGLHKQPEDYNYLGDLRIVDISNLLGEDWERLAPSLGITENEIKEIKARHPASTAQQAQSMIQIFKMTKQSDRNILEDGLRSIAREDIIPRCVKLARHTEPTKQDLMFRKHLSLENGYDEHDIMKDSESVEELVLQEDKKLQQMREREEVKYSAEEKVVEESESDDENTKKSVAERRQKIEKRLSVERQIPASTQKKEIVQEITEIKRKSLIEDKKAIHEEEIMLQMPTDNIIKSAVVSDQIIKLKTNKIETPDVSKSEFDRELQDKFKKTGKGSEDSGDQGDEYVEISSKIVYDSTVTEKGSRKESTTTKYEDVTISSKVDDTKKPDRESPPKAEPVVETVERKVVEKLTETIKEVHDKSEQIITDNKFSTDILTSDTKKESFKKTVVEKTDEIDADLERKLSIQKEKIEKSTEQAKDTLIKEIKSTAETVVTSVVSTTTASEATTTATTIHAAMYPEDELMRTLSAKTKFDMDHQPVQTEDKIMEEFVRKSYAEKPRESLTDAELYKSIEETITKKMSEGLIQISDDIISAASREIPDSKTPPPTPIDLHLSKDGKQESPRSIPEDIAEAPEGEEVDVESVSESIKGDYDYLRNEAIILVDSVLEQSIMAVNAAQLQCNNTDYNSESEHYAITCDVNGVDMVKSPTIESMSGKSFDDNISSNDDNYIVSLPSCTTTTTTTTTTTIAITTTSSTSIPNNNNIINDTNVDKSDFLDHHNIIICDQMRSNNVVEANITTTLTTATTITTAKTTTAIASKDFDRIERKFERLSSQLDDIDDTSERFEKNFGNLSKDEISNLQSDFSKISWDESASENTTAADVGLSTPDNDLQDLPTEPGSRITTSSDTDIPKPTPRITKITTPTASIEPEKEIEKSRVTKDEIVIGTSTTTKTDIESESSIDIETAKKKAEEIDFKHSKKFWESLESQSSQSAEIPTSIPVPKPRSQLKTTVETPKPEPDRRDDSIDSTTSQKDSSQDSRISSEQQVEYSEGSSLHTSLNDDKYDLRDDSQKSDIKPDEDLLQKHDDQKIEEKTPSKEDVPKDKDDIITQEQDAKTEEETSSKQASFYIGESSTNIITKSSTEKRNQYAFDNKGYDDTLDDEEHRDDKTSIKSIPSEEHDVKKLIDFPSEIVDDTISDKSKSISSDQIIRKDADLTSLHVEEVIETDDEGDIDADRILLSDEDKISTKIFRQDSETRNDILELDHSVEPTEEDIRKTDSFPTIEESAKKPSDIIQTAEVVEPEAKFETVVHRESVLHHVYFEDEATPMMQQAVREEIPTHIAEIHEEQKLERTEETPSHFEEKTQVLKKEMFGVEVVESKEYETLEEHEVAIEPMDIQPTDEVTQVAELSSVKVESELLEKATMVKEDIHKGTETESLKDVPGGKSRTETKLELNLDKSELELSEKSFKRYDDDLSSPASSTQAVLSPIKGFKSFSPKKFTLDPSEIDESLVEKTLAEVTESLDAVQEQLIEVVKDGRLIKQSPSEFEFKILPYVHSPADTIEESFQESDPTHSKYRDYEAGSPEKVKSPTTTRTTSPQPEPEEAKGTQSPALSVKAESVSSAEDTSSKLDVVHRVRKDHKIDSLNRWSVPDLDHSSSGDSHYQSFEKSDSRPCSSDVENLLTYGNSSEYQTAFDASSSIHPESTEYVSAVSTFDHSGKTISSHESMKSLDSESSANLGSIEVSEISETLVPSIADAEPDVEGQDLDFDADEGDVKLSSLEDKFCGVLMEDFQKEEKPAIPSMMKRSQEMTFTAEQSRSIDSPDFTEEGKVGLRMSSHIEELRSEETKFASSLEDGSVLSMSLSSASCGVDTVVENIEDLAGSLGASSLAGVDVLIRDDYAGTSFEEPHERIDSLTMTSSVGKEDEKHYANTQITTTTVTTETKISEGVEEPKRTKSHKRTESTAFTSDFLKGIETDIQKELKEPSDSFAEEDSITEDRIDHGVKRESESESDYDQYESEYSRAYKSPTTQKKGKEKHIETFEKEQEPEKRPFTPSQSVSEVIVEDEELEAMKLEEPIRRPSQNMQDYSKVPDITVTEDVQKSSDEGEDDFPDKVLYKVKTQEGLDKAEDAPIHYAQEQEYSVTEDQYQDLVQRHYEPNVADITTKYINEDEELKADSPDSFEMLEQPDISDEFVIIEEVAKEADEFDTEGKSISIKNVKYVKRHDEEVEHILVKSAPAAPNEGSAMYMRGDDLNFDFEESPPTGPDQAEEDAAETAAANKRWVEMQLSDNASHLRYPYDMERGVLEDIKEEDTEFEVGSSRISSFKDSFSSTPDYDVLAGRRYFTREHDDISMSSLQEFENLEQAISLENRRIHQGQGSQDSLSNGSFSRRYIMRCGGQGDDISLSSLKEFEGLENACIEAHLIEIKAKEEAALLLSRSDESNKSGNSEGGATTTTTTKVVTVKPDGTPEGSTVTTVTKVVTTTTSQLPSSAALQASLERVPLRSAQEIEALIKSKLEECEEESSNIMEVSTDSLETGMKKSESQNGKEGSQVGSCDSLEINKSVGDIMTSSIDSFEISKDATAKSSRSDVDSLEQQLPAQDVRRDSIDSIELQYALQASKLERDSLDEGIKSQILPTSTTTSTVTTITQESSGNLQTITKTTITTTSASSSHHEMTKDISSDSLNLNQTDPDLLLTSTESLDHTSSTATNATYQNENDSMMSGSMTSCGSNTMIDTLETTFADMQYQGPSSSSHLLYDPRSPQQPQQPQTYPTSKDGEKRYEYFEIFDKDLEKLDTKQSESGDETRGHEQKPEEQKK